MDNGITTTHRYLTCTNASIIFLHYLYSKTLPGLGIDGNDDRFPGIILVEEDDGRLTPGNHLRRRQIPGNGDVFQIGLSTAAKLNGGGIIGRVEGFKDGFMDGNLL
ncbi:MAG: hypothetical protein Q7J73_09720 [Dehalococcoidales bacterium]|nr:hypothetical protein [Dehalococcoidales bacterium]